MTENEIKDKYENLLITLAEWFEVDMDKAAKYVKIIESLKSKEQV